MKKTFFVSPSFFIPLLFLVFSCSPKEILLFLSAVLLHEFGHILAIYLLGYKVESFSLSLTGATISPSSRYIPYRKEILIFLAGPLGNAVGLLFSFFLLRLDFTKDGMLLFFSNFLLLVFNLFPIRGLDGERALFAFLCLFLEMEKSEKYLSFINFVFLFFLFFFSVQLLISKRNPSLFLLSFSLIINDSNHRKRSFTNLNKIKKAT